MTDSEIDITPPTEGGVILQLNFEDAEILARIVGLTNCGSLNAASPVLLKFVDQMTTVVGRNSKFHAANWLAIVGQFGQIYINKVDDIS